VTATRAAALLIASSLASCGGGPPPEAPVVQSVGPEDEILAVSSEWESSQGDKGLKSEPSKVSVFESRQLSHVSFQRGSATAQEHLIVEENFRMRDGQTFVCRVELKTPLSVRFARRGPDPAVELTRPAANLLRQCDHPGFPEPTLVIPGAAARFVLRNEQLVAYEPPLEKRVFLPVQ